MQTLSDILR